MSLLIINASSKNSPEIENAIGMLANHAQKCKVINTLELNILPCMGCYTCMLKTPGVCCLNDDYEEIFKLYFDFDHVIFISDIALNFVNHRTKNIADRMFPFVSILTFFKDGEIRHIPRYDKKIKLGLLYTDIADDELLNTWLHRFAINMMGESIGAFHINDVKEVYACIS